MVLEVRKVITILEECCPWYIFTAKQETQILRKAAAKSVVFRPQKSEKSPAKSWRDLIIIIINN